MSAAPTPDAEQVAVTPPSVPRDGLFARRRVRRSIKLTITGLCALVLAVAAYRGYLQVDGYWHWRHAHAALDRLDLQGARHDLELCAAIWPDSGETHFQLARVTRRLGDFDAARADLREAKRLHWVDEQIQLEYLLLEAQTGAIPSVESGLTLLLGNGHPDEPLIFEALIRGCLESRFLSKAGRWGTIWVQRHPDDWQAHWWNGQAQDSLDNAALALQNFKMVVSSAPYFAEGHRAVGNVLFREGRLQEALSEFQQAVKQEPDHAGALLGLAQCQRDLPNMSENAVATLDHALALNPDDVGALLLRGQLELDADRPQAALPYFRKAGDLAPGDRSAAHSLSTVYSRLHDLPAADRYEKRYRELEALYRRLGHVLTETRTDDRNADLRAEAGNIYLQLDQPADALHWLVSALLIDRDNTQGRKGLEQCLRSLGDPKLVEQAKTLLAPRASAEQHTPGIDF